MRFKKSYGRRRRGGNRNRRSIRSYYVSRGGTRL